MVFSYAFGTPLGTALPCLVLSGLVPSRLAAKRASCLFLPSHSLSYPFACVYVCVRECVCVFPCLKPRPRRPPWPEGCAVPIGRPCLAPALAPAPVPAPLHRNVLEPKRNEKHQTVPVAGEAFGGDGIGPSARSVAASFFFFAGASLLLLLSGFRLASVGAGFKTTYTLCPRRSCFFSFLLLLFVSSFSCSGFWPLCPPASLSLSPSLSPSRGLGLWFARAQR